MYFPYQGKLEFLVSLLYEMTDSKEHENILFKDQKIEIKDKLSISPY